MREHELYLVANGRNTHKRPAGMDNQTALAIHELQEEVALKDLIKAATATAVVTALSAIPQGEALAAGSQENIGIFEKAVRYASKNWQWAIPLTAAVDGIVDGLIEEVKNPGQMPIRDYFGKVITSAAVEAGEMTLVLLAAEQIVNHPDQHPALNTIGKVILPFAAAYAVLPDAAGEYLRPAIDRAIDSTADALKSVNSRQVRGNGNGSH